MALLVTGSEGKIEMRRMTVEVEHWPIDGVFTISRGSKTEAEVVTVRLEEEISGTIYRGCGECVPYKRYGEGLESVVKQINSIMGDVEAGADKSRLQSLLPAGAARNAVDCALWDLEAKISGKPVFSHFLSKVPGPVQTVKTISLGSPEQMRKDASAMAGFPVIKVKLGTDDDIARMRAVAAGAPNSRFIVDANEGWTVENVGKYLAIAEECRVALVEQPLPAGNDQFLAEIAHPVPICADESAHVSDDLPRLKGLYDVINIKLDKTGGLTEALKLLQGSRKAGFQVMIGCMVGTSLAMAPAQLLAQEAEFVDIDGPLLLAKDREPGLRYDVPNVYPPEAALWG